MRHGPLLRLASLAAIGSIAITGCVSQQPTGGKTSSAAPSSSGSQSNGQPNTERAIQTHTFVDENTTLKVEVLSLARLNGKFLKLRLRFTAPEATDALTDVFGDRSFNEVSLLDGNGMKAYYPATDSKGNVMNSGYPDGSITAGTPYTASIFYPSPPTSVTKVDINLPSCPTFTDIPIQGTARVEAGEPDPTKAALAAPDIEDLQNTVEDLNGDKSVDDSNKGENIRLNTDVLFALNKATLSDKAKGILKDVANRIDKASTTTIKVDGYTDNSGNDAINNPLSQHRAQAVAAELKKLVTRKGVTYRTAGHGSADPIASNDSADGRKQNRRVTVSIGK